MLLRPALGLGVALSTLVVTIQAHGCGHGGGAAEDETPATEPAASAIPRGRVTADALQVEGMVHHEVLRIEQTFHPDDDYRVVIDAWTANGMPEDLVAVRIGWVDGAGTRSVFGRGVRRHLDFQQRRIDPHAIEILLAHGDVEQRIVVRAGPAAEVGAYVDAQVGNELVSNCRATWAALRARELFGLPIGLARIDVACTDGEGTAVEGQLVERKAASG